MVGEIKKAVILAAGLGVRLKPFTDEVPKCLTEVNGTSILEHTLEILEENGIDETVLVVGYLGDVILNKIGKKYRNMKISYIWNKIFDKTNSMYSAWLAKNYLKQGVILIEGDTIFEKSLMESLINTSVDKAYWAVNKFTEDFDGSMSITDKSERIIELKIVRGSLGEYKENYFKSTGVLKITSDYGKLFSGWLDEDVANDNVDIYYDLVIAQHLHDHPIYIFDVTNKSKWVEIDDFDDLQRSEFVFRSTKYVMILMDGAADLPISGLGNRTPFEAADIHSVDFLTKNGKSGLIKTMYLGLPICSIVANLGILGYNPSRYYPNGRASFEALAKGIYLDDNDIVLRCNLLAIENGKIKDFTACNIKDNEARRIIENLKLSDNRMEIFPGQSYRNLFILRDMKFNSKEIQAFEPHMNIGKPLKELLLKGSINSSKKVTDYLNGFMLDTIKQIKILNREFKTKADMIFLWSPSSTPRLFSFHRKFGIDGAIVSGLDFTRGIGIAARMAVKKTKCATGYSDTDLSEKLKDAKNHLMHNDLVFIHINAPDEESHNKNVKGKIDIIERIDREIIKPMLEFLDRKFPEKYRIAIMTDHYTLLKDGTHLAKPVPYTVYGEGIEKDNIKYFSEREIEKKNRVIIKSYEFMDFFLRKKE